MVKINQMTIRLYWQHLKRHSGLGAVMVLATVFASLINVIIPIFLKNFFDILGIAGLDKSAVNTLTDILIVIAILELVSWVFWRVSTFAAAHFEARVIAD
jgi:ABC-type multidrug transport system fused ATPase/permease subunit